MKRFAGILFCVLLLVAGCGKKKVTSPEDNNPHPIISINQLGSLETLWNAYPPPQFSEDHSALYVMTHDSQRPWKLFRYNLSNGSNPTLSYSFPLPNDLCDSTDEHNYPSILLCNDKLVISFSGSPTQQPSCAVYQVSLSDTASLLYTPALDGGPVSYHAGNLYTCNTGSTYQRFSAYDTRQSSFPLLRGLDTFSLWDNIPGVNRLPETIHFINQYAVIKFLHINGDSTSVIVTYSDPSAMGPVLADIRSHLYSGKFAAYQNYFFLCGRAGMGLPPDRLEAYRVNGNGSVSKLSTLALSDSCGTVALAIGFPFLAAFCDDGHVRVIDITHPDAPVLMGSVSFLADEYSLWENSILSMQHPFRWYGISWPTP